MPHSRELSHKEWALACLNGNVRAMTKGRKTQADVDAWMRGQTMRVASARAKPRSIAHAILPLACDSDQARRNAEPPRPAGWCMRVNPPPWLAMRWRTRSAALFVSRDARYRGPTMSAWLSRHEGQ
jgi:hypothetical protein